MPIDSYSQSLHELRDAVTVHIAVYEQCGKMECFLKDLNATASDLDAAIRSYETVRVERG